MSTLEQRITAAMTAPIASADLTVLIGDVENSLAAAIANAQEHAKSALDITAGDGRMAFEKSQEFDLISKRLRICLPKLQDRLIVMINAEEAVKWNAEHARVQALVAAEAEKFAAVGDLLVRLAERFAAAKAVDEQAAQFNISAPGGMRVSGVELTARNMQSFCRDWPSILDKAVIPSWQPTSKLLWPPPRNAAALAAMFAPIDAGPAYGPYWHEVVAERQRQLIKIAEESARK